MATAVFVKTVKTNYDTSQLCNEACGGIGFLPFRCVFMLPLHYHID